MLGTIKKQQVKTKTPCLNYLFQGQGKSCAHLEKVTNRSTAELQTLGTLKCESIAEKTKSSKAEGYLHTFIPHPVQSKIRVWSSLSEGADPFAPAIFRPR